MSAFRTRLAEPRAEPGRAGQGRAELGRAELGRAELGRAGQGRAELGRAGQGRAELSPSRADAAITAAQTGIIIRLAEEDTGYLLDNRQAEAGTQFDAPGRLFDAPTGAGANRRGREPARARLSGQAS